MYKFYFFFLLIVPFVILAEEEDASLKPGAELRVDVSHLPLELAEFNGEKLLAKDFLNSVARRLNPLAKQKISQAELSRFIITLIHEKYDRIVSLELAALDGIEPNIGLSFLELQNMEKELGQKAVTEELLKNGIEYKDAAKYMAESKAVDEWFREKILPVSEVNEAEALLYYSENKEKLAMKDRVKFAQIYIGFHHDKEKKLARKNIAEANYDLTIGKEFHETAVKYSQGSFAPKGGVQDRYYNEDELIEELKPIMSLDIGQRTNVIESKTGFHIVKIIDKRKAGIPTFSEIKKGLLFTMSMEKAKSLMRLKIEQRKKELGFKILIGQ
ncbi:MAG: peptidylprolyl isomerase [Lentisphaeraceae bacterium]|nr:peptidylprolyl isomerase [Lentisphaeraceae bacterium]